MIREITTIPNKLYRFFKEKDHAEYFISGYVRFGTLQKYKEDEDLERGDKTEGNGDLTIQGESLVFVESEKSIYSIPGTENLSVVGDPRNHFICCFAACEQRDLSELANMFGHYCVVINNPDCFIKDLKLAAANNSKLSLNPPNIEYGLIRYDKFHNHFGDISDEEKLALVWRQKPKRFSNQREFRVHFNFTTHELIDYPDDLTLHIQSDFSYCEQIDLNSQRFNLCK